MKAEELHELIRLRRTATEILEMKKPEATVTVGGNKIRYTGSNASSFANGMLMAVKMLEQAANL